MLVAAFVALFCYWGFKLLREFRDYDKQRALPEPDPLKELEEAHRTEIAEWDALFLKATGKPVFPPVANDLESLRQQGLYWKRLFEDAQNTQQQQHQQAMMQALANQTQRTQQEMYQQALGSQQQAMYGSYHHPGLGSLFDGLLGGKHGRH